jgi:hypothetical protein
MGGPARTVRMVSWPQRRSVLGIGELGGMERGVVDIETRKLGNSESPNN